jgi:hypothetical protein
MRIPKRFPFYVHTTWTSLRKNIGGPGIKVEAFGEPVEDTFIITKETGDKAWPYFGFPMYTKIGDDISGYDGYRGGNGVGLTKKMINSGRELTKDEEAQVNGIIDKWKEQMLLEDI